MFFFCISRIAFLSSVRMSSTYLGSIITCEMGRRGKKEEDREGKERKGEGCGKRREERGRKSRREQRREFKNYIGSKAFIIHVFTMPQLVK